MRRVKWKTVMMLLFSAFVSTISLLAVAEAGQKLADVNGVSISDERVEQALGAPLANLQEQVYSMKRQMLETLINEQLLLSEAEKRGMSTTALLDAEVTSKVGLVTEQEIDAVYKSHKTQVKGEESAVREQIRARLQMQKLATQREAFLNTLRSQGDVTVYLHAPPIFRAAVDANGAPFKGSALAPVTIVKFEDFHCPYCRRVQATFTELLATYTNKVRLVHRDFPLDGLHPSARKAHEAARCAEEQGSFWAYHDVLYSNAPKASTEDLRAYAQEVGLNLSNFERCLSSGKYETKIQQDIEEGGRLGVTATPVFFINGRQLVGAQPLESFTHIIDDELARAQTGAGETEKTGTP